MTKSPIWLAFAWFLAFFFTGFMGTAVFSASGSNAETEALLKGYVAVQIALANDKAKGHEAITAQKAKQLSIAAEAWLALKSGPASLNDAVFAVKSASLELAAEGTTSLQRDAFAKISQAVVTIIKEQIDLRPDWQLFFCPMVNQYWVQPCGARVNGRCTEKINNPYMGTAMPKCGSRVEWKDLP